MASDNAVRDSKRGILVQTTTFRPLFTFGQIPNPIINQKIIHLTHNAQHTMVTCILGTLLVPFTQVTFVKLCSCLTIEKFVTVEQLLTIPKNLLISRYC